MFEFVAYVFAFWVVVAVMPTGTRTSVTFAHPIASVRRKALAR